jgi:flagellar capping protein FliD
MKFSDDELTMLVDSYEWLIKDDLKKIDYRIKSLQKQATKINSTTTKREQLIKNKLSQWLHEVRKEVNG